VKVEEDEEAKIRIAVQGKAVKRGKKMKRRGRGATLGWKLHKKRNEKNEKGVWCARVKWG